MYIIYFLLYIFSDNDIDITNLDIPVNAVATALKDFFSKKLPPLFTDEIMDELEDLSGKLFYVKHYYILKIADLKIFSYSINILHTLIVLPLKNVLFYLKFIYFTFIYLCIHKDRQF